MGFSAKSNDPLWFINAVGPYTMEIKLNTLWHSLWHTDYHFYLYIRLL